MLGDPIEVDGASVPAVGEFSRLHLGKDRFAVEAANGLVYEVEIANAGNGTRGSQKWRATRRLTRDEFENLARSSVV
jgi:hypothetical protein